jgi:hypothetical protein
MRVGAYLAAAGALLTSEPCIASTEGKQEVSSAEKVGLMISGPGFMATFGDAPADQLVAAETNDAAANVSLTRLGTDYATQASVRVVRLGDGLPAEYLRSLSRVAEGMFLDELNAACSTPVRLSRSQGIPNVASEGARPDRLEAACEQPRDAQWSNIRAVSETLTNGSVRCSWSVRYSSRVPATPIPLMVQDICVPVIEAQRSGRTTISVIRQGAAK